MIRTYSKRLLSPFTGLVQIAESDRARALSLEGKDWEIQFRVDPANTGKRSRTGPPQKKHYVRVAGIRATGIQRFKLPYHLDDGVVEEQILELADYLKEAVLRFQPAHKY